MSGRTRFGLVVMCAVSGCWTGEARFALASAVDTRMLASPAITVGKIAFVYADDIWVADSDGSHPRRVTSHAGEERNPFFSPDGKQIAFTASYDGNVDVYVIRAEGARSAAVSGSGAATGWILSKDRTV